MPDYPYNFNQLFPDYRSQLTGVINMPYSDSRNISPYTQTMPSQTADSPSSVGMPQSLEEIDLLYKQGQITLEQANQMELSLNAPQSSTTPNPNINEDGSLNATDGYLDRNSQRQWGGMPLLNFAGSNLETELFSLGTALGAERGTQGRGLGIVSSAGAFGLGAARNLVGGIGYQRQNENQRDWYEEQLQRRQYVPISQTQNTNNLGGFVAENGGTFATGGIFDNLINRRRLTEAERQAMLPQNNGGDPTIVDPNLRGYRAPLDGSTQDPNQQAGLALFPNAYGDINWFAENKNQFRSRLEADPNQNTVYVDADGNVIESVPNPDNLESVSAITLAESRQRARDINRQIRREDLPYQKIQKDAFVTPGSGAIKFEQGGTKTGQEFTRQIGDSVTFMYQGQKKTGVIKEIKDGQIFI